jgi:hypothetical protein
VRENRVYARQIHPLPTFGWICRRSLTGGSLSCNRRQHLSSHGILDPPPVTKTERRMDSRKKGVCCQTVTPSGYKSMISFSFHPLKRMEEEIICNRWKDLAHLFLGSQVFTLNSLPFQPGSEYTYSNRHGSIRKFERIERSMRLRLGTRSLLFLSLPTTGK